MTDCMHAAVVMIFSSCLVNLSLHMVSKMMAFLYPFRREKRSLSEQELAEEGGHWSASCLYSSSRSPKRIVVEASGCAVKRYSKAAAWTPQ